MRAFRQVLLEPLRAAVLPLLVLCGCPSSSREASEDAGASSTSNVRLLETHRGATSLWHDNGLWVSAKADEDGRKPVQRFDRRCDFGVGLAFVDGTLWVAPP